MADEAVETSSVCMSSTTSTNSSSILIHPPSNPIHPSSVPQLDSIPSKPIPPPPSQLIIPTLQTTNESKRLDAGLAGGQEDNEGDLDEMQKKMTDENNENESIAKKGILAESEIISDKKIVDKNEKSDQKTKKCTDEKSDGASEHILCAGIKQEFSVGGNLASLSIKPPTNYEDSQATANNLLPPDPTLTKSALVSIDQKSLREVDAENDYVKNLNDSEDFKQVKIATGNQPFSANSLPQPQQLFQPPLSTQPTEPPILPQLKKLKTLPLFQQEQQQQPKLPLQAPLPTTEEQPLDLTCPDKRPPSPEIPTCLPTKADPLVEHPLDLSLKRQDEMPPRFETSSSSLKPTFEAYNHFNQSTLLQQQFNNPQQNNDVQSYINKLQQQVPQFQQQQQQLAGDCDNFNPSQPLRGFLLQQQQQPQQHQQQHKCLIGDVNNPICVDDMDNQSSRSIDSTNLPALLLSNLQKHPNNKRENVRNATMSGCVENVFNPNINQSLITGGSGSNWNYVGLKRENQFQNVLNNNLITSNSSSDDFLKQQQDHKPPRYNQTGKITRNKITPQNRFLLPNKPTFLNRNNAGSNKSLSNDIPNNVAFTKNNDARLFKGDNADNRLNTYKNHPLVLSYDTNANTLPNNRGTQAKSCGLTAYLNLQSFNQPLNHSINQTIATSLITNSGVEITMTSNANTHFDTLIKSHPSENPPNQFIIPSHLPTSSHFQTFSNFSTLNHPPTSLTYPTNTSLTLITSTQCTLTSHLQRSEGYLLNANVTNYSTCTIINSNITNTCINNFGHNLNNISNDNNANGLNTYLVNNLSSNRDNMIQNTTGNNTIPNMMNSKQFSQGRNSKIIPVANVQPFMKNRLKTFPRVEPIIINPSPSPPPLIHNPAFQNLANPINHFNTSLEYNPINGGANHNEQSQFIHSSYPHNLPSHSLISQNQSQSRTTTTNTTNTTNTQACTTSPHYFQFSKPLLTSSLFNNTQCYFDSNNIPQSPSKSLRPSKAPTTLQETMMDFPSNPAIAINNTNSGSATNEPPPENSLVTEENKISPNKNLKISSNNTSDVNNNATKTTSRGLNTPAKKFSPRPNETKYKKKQVSSIEYIDDDVNSSDENSTNKQIEKAHTQKHPNSRTSSHTSNHTQGHRDAQNKTNNKSNPNAQSGTKNNIKSNINNQINAKVHKNNNINNNMNNNTIGNGNEINQRGVGNSSQNSSYAPTKITTSNTTPAPANNITYNYNNTTITTDNIAMKGMPTVDNSYSCSNNNNFSSPPPSLYPCCQTTSSSSSLPSSSSSSSSSSYCERINSASNVEKNTALKHLNGDIKKEHYDADSYAKSSETCEDYENRQNNNNNFSRTRFSTPTTPHNNNNNNNNNNTPNTIYNLSTSNYPKSPFVNNNLYINNLPKNYSATNNHFAITHPQPMPNFHATSNNSNPEILNTKPELTGNGAYNGEAFSSEENNFKNGSKRNSKGKAIMKKSHWRARGMIDNPGPSHSLSPPNQLPENLSSTNFRSPLSIQTAPKQISQSNPFQLDNKNNYENNEFNNYNINKINNEGMTQNNNNNNNYDVKYNDLNNNNFRGFNNNLNNQNNNNNNNNVKIYSSELNNNPNLSTPCKSKGNNSYKKINNNNNKNNNHNYFNTNNSNTNSSNIDNIKTEVKPNNLSNNPKYGFYCSPLKPTTKGRHRKNNNNPYPIYLPSTTTPHPSPITKNLGETKLHHATKAQSIALVHKYLSEGQINSNAQDNLGVTPLHISTLCNNLPLTELLLSYGAIPNAKALDGTRPIDNVITRGTVRMMDLLLRYGADVTLRRPQEVKGRRMRKYLGGVVSQLKGKSDGNFLWGFPGSNKENSLLSGLPPDDTEDNPEVRGSNTTFDILPSSSFTCPPVFAVQLKQHSSPTLCHLLSDVCKFLSSTQKAFLNKHLNNKNKNPQEKNTPHDKNTAQDIPIHSHNAPHITPEKVILVDAGQISNVVKLFEDSSATPPTSQSSPTSHNHALPHVAHTTPKTDAKSTRQFPKPSTPSNPSPSQQRYIVINDKLKSIMKIEVCRTHECLSHLKEKRKVPMDSEAALVNSFKSLQKGANKIADVATTSNVTTNNTTHTTTTSSDIPSKTPASTLIESTSCSQSTTTPADPATLRTTSCCDERMKETAVKNCKESPDNVSSSCPPKSLKRKAALAEGPPLKSFKGSTRSHSNCNLIEGLSKLAKICKSTVPLVKNITNKGKNALGGNSKDEVSGSKGLNVANTKDDVAKASHATCSVKKKRDGSTKNTELVAAGTSNSGSQATKRGEKDEVGAEGRNGKVMKRRI